MKQILLQSWRGKPLQPNINQFCMLNNGSSQSSHVNDFLRLEIKTRQLNPRP